MKTILFILVLMFAYVVIFGLLIAFDLIDWSRSSAIFGGVIGILMMSGLNHLDNKG